MKSVSRPPDGWSERYEQLAHSDSRLATQMRGRSSGYGACFSTRSENFGFVIGEALAAGIPVLTTRETPWKDLEARGCGWAIAATHEALSQALRATLSLPLEELKARGVVGKAWMNRDFSWKVAAARLLEAYDDTGRS